MAENATDSDMDSMHNKLAVAMGYFCGTLFCCQLYLIMYITLISVISPKIHRKIRIQVYATSTTKYTDFM